MESLFPTITIVSAVLMTTFIMLQNRGASLGAGFGGTSEIYTTRRGIDKVMHQITIILAIVFVLSIILDLLQG